MTCKITMGKIKPGHIHSSFDHLLNHLRGIRGRTNGTNQFCFVFRQNFHVNYYSMRFLVFEMFFEGNRSGSIYTYDTITTFIGIDEDGCGRDYQGAQ